MRLRVRAPRCESISDRVSNCHHIPECDTNGTLMADWANAPFPNPHESLSARAEQTARRLDELAGKLQLVIDKSARRRKQLAETTGRSSASDDYNDLRATVMREQRPLTEAGPSACDGEGPKWCPDQCAFTPKPREGSTCALKRSG